MLTSTLTLSRIGLALAVFCYCAWRDYKTREVENKVWCLAMPLAILLAVVEFVLFSPSLLTSYLFSVVFSSVLSIVLFYIGVLGGADAKAIIFLALSLPFCPTQVLPTLFPSIVARYCFPLATFFNTLLITTFVGVVFFIINLRDFCRTGDLFEKTKFRFPYEKILALFSARRIPLNDLKTKRFWFPLEKLGTVDETQTIFVLLPQFEERDTVISQLSKNFVGTKLIWATPGVPLIVYMLFGLVIALCLGDAFWLLEYFFAV